MPGVRRKRRRFWARKTKITLRWSWIHHAFGQKQWGIWSLHTIPTAPTEKNRIDLMNFVIILQKNSHLRTKGFGPQKSNFYLQSCFLTFSVSQCSLTSSKIKGLMSVWCEEKRKGFRLFPSETDEHSFPVNLIGCILKKGLLYTVDWTRSLLFSLPKWLVCSSEPQC